MVRGVTEDSREGREPITLRAGRKPIPNYTQVPNVVIDFYIPQLQAAEVRVLLFMLRMTVGFHREEVQLTLKRIANGRVGADGKRIEWGCGLAKSTISKALVNLETYGLVERQRDGRQGTVYVLNIDEEAGKER